jgi:hypothetical protein
MGPQVKGRKKQKKADPNWEPNGKLPPILALNGTIMAMLGSKVS